MMRSMRRFTAKRVGVGLVLAGLAGLAITALQMSRLYSTPGTKTPPALAEGIDATLMPATIGAGLALAGVILLVVPWWRRRRSTPKIVPLRSV